MTGINTDAVKIACFILTGTLAALGGMLVVARIKAAEPQIGVGWELDIIAATIMGGVSFLGGIGTVIGAFLGTILMQLVRSGLVIAKVSAYWQNAVIGLLLILGVAIDAYRRKARKRVG